MKAEYTVDHATLLDTVVEMKRVTDGSMPITTSVRITGDEDQLVLTATDLDVYLTRMLTHQTTRVVPGILDVCVDAKKLHKVLSGVKGDTAVRLVAKEAGKLSVTVSSIGVTVTLPSTMDSQDYPQSPEDGDGVGDPAEIVAEWDACDDRASGLAFVAEAMSTDEIRLNLNGAYFDHEAGRIVATDGYRLHLDGTGGLLATVLMSSSAMEFLVRMTGKKRPPEAFVVAKFDKGGADHVRIVAEGGWRMIARCVDGQYPAVDQVIWDETSEEAAVVLKGDGPEVFRALKQAAKFAPAVKIHITDEGVKAVACEVDEPEVEVDLPLKVTRQTGGPIVIGLNVNYLLGVVKYADKEVEIHIKNYGLDERCDLDGYIIVIGDRRKAVVMPMRV